MSNMYMRPACERNLLVMAQACAQIPVGWHGMAGKRTLLRICLQCEVLLALCSYVCHIRIVARPLHHIQ